MKVAFRWFGGTVIALVLVLLALHKNTEIVTDVWIERPPADVWQILTATDEYPGWNPFIRRVDGAFRTGSEIDVEIVPPNSSPMIFRAVVIAVDQDREIRWRGSLRVRGLFDGEHIFRLESEGGRTHLIQAEKFSGLLVGRLSVGILRNTRRGFVAMNEALQTRAESDHREQSQWKTSD
jgi:hypothetical protein